MLEHKYTILHVIYTAILFYPFNLLYYLIGYIQLHVYVFMNLHTYILDILFSMFCHIFISIQARVNFVICNILTLIEDLQF